MRDFRRLRPFTTLLLLLLVTAQTHAMVSIISMSQAENRQSLALEFQVKGTPDCVLNTLLDYRHVAHVSDKVDSVELISNRDDRQLVSYRYEGFLYRYEAIYERWRVPGQNSIRYQLSNYRQSGLPVPRLRSSSGLYQVSKDTDHSRVTLSQEIVIEQSLLSSLYFKQAHDEAIEFAENLANFINAQCSHNEQEKASR